MIYLLGNNIHIRIKVYDFRIRLKTYKHLNQETARKFEKL